MRLISWMLTILMIALSLAALAVVAAAQVPFEKLPKVLDASVPRDEQISIALSACPEKVAKNATVYVLGPKGFEIARQGTNGASSLVGRHFIKPDETSIEPMCYDPEGSQTLLHAELFKEELRSKGTSEDDIKAEVAKGYADGRFKGPSKPGVLYMLSSDNRLGPTASNGTTHVPPHFMFYAPNMTGKDLGYETDAPVAPFLANPGKPNALMVVFPDPNPSMK